MVLKNVKMPNNGSSAEPPYPQTRVLKNVKVPNNGSSYTEEQLKGMFWRSDANGDGRLSKQELKNAFASLGSSAPWLRATIALWRADKNKDGYINEDELDNVVRHAAKRGYTIK